ncbi:hypothetical protein IWQ62_002810 [Dispira parvispora]|uniref:Uncharacterized protein n=1 Tax=Dispira parvispora TaxID=1520584 RepID=A0A9W8AUZ1_9FUNG|nr:hypothetical protein IWQ62_002810 [Dispira parvispora]
MKGVPYSLFQLGVLVALLFLHTCPIQATGVKTGGRIFSRDNIVCVKECQAAAQAGNGTDPLMRRNNCVNQCVQEGGDDNSSSKAEFAIEDELMLDEDDNTSLTESTSATVTLYNGTSQPTSSPTPSEGNFGHALVYSLPSGLVLVMSAAWALL